MFFLLLLLVGRVLIRVTPMLFRRLYWGLWVQYMLYMLPLSMMATALHLLISNLSFIGFLTMNRTHNTMRAIAAAVQGCHTEVVQLAFLPDGRKV